MNQQLKDSPMKQASNEHASVSYEIKSGCCVEADLTLKADKVKEIHAKAIKAIGKEAELPGFRKGHLPTNILEKNFEREIGSKFDQMIAQEAFIEALVLCSVRIVQERPTLKSQVKSKKENGEVVVHLSFQCYPTVPEISVDGIEIKVEAPQAIEEKDIDEAIDNMRLYFAEWESVEKAAEEGDFVRIDVSDIEQTPPRLLFKDQQFKISEGNMAPWLHANLLGKKAGDVCEAKSEVDASATEEQKKAFVPTQCRIEVKEVRLAKMPALDEELAKRVGAGSLEDMRVNIRQMLENQAKEAIRNQERSQLVDAVLDKTPFDVPQMLVDLQTETLAQKMTANLYSNASLDRSVLTDQQEKINKDAHLHAERMVRLSFIIQELAHKEQLKPSEQEVMGHMMRSVPMEVIQQLSDKKHEEERERMIAQSNAEVTELKVLDHLLEKIEKK